MRATLLLLALLATLFVVAALTTPLLERAGLPGGAVVRRALAPVCHQEPSRSLAIASRPVPVCARCAGLYVGGWLALLLVAAVPAPLLGAGSARALVLASLPTALDLAARVVGAAGLPNLPRLAAALPLGFVAGLLVAEAVADLACMRRA